MRDPLLAAPRIAAFAGLGLLFAAIAAGPAYASTGTCDVSPGEYTAYAGTDPLTDTSPPASTAGLSSARCMKTIRTLGSVVEGVFKDAKGKTADQLPSYGKLFNTHAGESNDTICNGFFAKGQRNVPSVQCVAGWGKTFAELSTYANGLDWKYVNPVRYDPAARKWCADPTMGCFGGQCYPSTAIAADGTLIAGSTPTAETCSAIDETATAISDGDTRFYTPWDQLVFDMGGLANKVAIFAVNDHGPQPCESNEYTVYLTNNPFSHDMIDNPGKDGADPKKWNRAKLFKVYTHGWIDNPDCCDSPSTCDPTKCALPAAGDAPKLEADSMTLVFSLPCGIAFRYAAFIAGYDGHSLTDPAAPADACKYDSFDAEIDAVAGLNDDETAICPDKDGDGFPTCECTPKPSPCDCVDDPAKDPDAKKYHPGAPQSCDGPEYSCAPTPCATGTFCYSHQCLKPCAPGEFKCTSGFTCQTASGADAGPDGGVVPQLCVPAPCGDAGTCEVGKVCIDGKCIDPCAPPTKCPVGQACQDGKCKDPCALVKCPAGQLCQGGTCHDNCACLAKTASGYPCTGATPTCDAKSGTCVPSGCDSTTCKPGEHCETTAGGPSCRGPCEGVVCPKGQTCDPAKGCVSPCDALTTPCAAGTVCKEKDGTCVEPSCANVDCSAPFVCKGGVCIDPGSGDICLTCDAGPSDSALTFDASTDDGGDDTGPASLGDNPNAQSSCGCTTVGSGAAGVSAIASMMTLLGLVMRRRRARR